MRIAILGGTGAEGRGLAARWAAAGYDVVLGSRDAARAAEAAAEVAGLVAAGGEAGPGGQIQGAPGVGTVRGATNGEAAAAGEIAVLTLPHGGLVSTLEGLRDQLAGKLVVSAVVPMTFVDGGPRLEPLPEGSAAQAAAAVLPGSRVVGAFHTVSAKHLLDLSHALDEDVPLAGAPEDRGEVEALCRAIGLRPVAAGGLSQAGLVEALTPMLVGVNRANRTTAGIRFTGL